MRVLVTGSTGFIGSRLCEVLREDNHEVWEMHRYDGGPPQERVLWCDLKDGDVQRVFDAAQPEIVIHLASITSAPYANQFPIETMQVIGTGTARVVEAARHGNLHAFVMASTADVYGSGTELSPRNPYAVAKVAAEQIVRYSSLPWVITRPANTYGRALVDNPQYVVDEAIQQAVTTGQITLRDPSPTRDFLFREDHVDGYRKIVRSVCEGDDLTGETFDLRSGEPVSIGQMAGIVAEETGLDPAKTTWSGSQRPNETRHVVVSYGHAFDRLGWSPRYNLRTGIRQAVAEWTHAGSLAHANAGTPEYRADG